jgi:hypothetical protein
LSVSNQRFFLLISALVFSINAVCQIKALKKPLEYFIPNGNWAQLNAKKSEQSVQLQAWVVLADGDSKPIFKDQNIIEKIDSTKFLQPYYVIRETDSLVQVALCNDSIEVEPNGNLKGTKLLGWIQKKDIVLWDNGLFPHKDYGQYRKLFPVISSQTFNPDSVSCNLNTSKRSIDSSRFFYVVKEKGNQVLISKSGYYRYPSHKNVIGWFPKSAFFEWDGNEGFFFLKNDTSLKSLSKIIKGHFEGLTLGSNPQRHSLVLPYQKNNVLFPSLLSQYKVQFETDFFSINSGGINFKKYSERISRAGLGIYLSDSTFVKSRFVHIIPLYQIEEMKRVVSEQLTNINFSERKQVIDGFRSLFGILSGTLGYPDSDFPFAVLRTYFGKDMYIPMSFRERRLSDLNNSSAIPDIDIQYFLGKNGLGKLLNTNDKVYELDFINEQGNNLYKIFF